MVHCSSNYVWSVGDVPRGPAIDDFGLNEIEEEEEEEEEEECFYSTIQYKTMIIIIIKDIYREQFGQETPIKMQLASLSWEPRKEKEHRNVYYANER